MTTQPVNPHEVHDLTLYANNTGELYLQKLSIIHNLKRRIKAGTYDPAKAPALWRHWYDDAARMYRREIAPAPPFSPATRQAAADEQAEHEYRRIIGGEYDDPQG